MKLFKRTSITLSIVIVLLWVFMMVWVNYTFSNSRVGETEKAQTKILLKENNIKAADEFLNKNGKALVVADVIYLLADGKAVEKACDEGKIKRGLKNQYTFDDSYITVDGTTVIIEGKTSIAEDLELSTALSKAKKIVSWLKLSYKDMSAYVREGKDRISVTFIPRYKGKHIFDLKIDVIFYGEGLYRVQAIPFKLKSDNKKVFAPSSCSALAELAVSSDASHCEITEMQLGYKTNETKLLPVWEIKTKNDVYYID